MDIVTSVHLGKRLHSQTCMLHFSAKHHRSRVLYPEDNGGPPSIFFFFYCTLREYL